MKKLVLATRNQNKVKEYNELLGADFKLLSLDDIGFGKENPTDFGLSDFCFYEIGKSLTIFLYSS